MAGRAELVLKLFNDTVSVALVVENSG